MGKIEIFKGINEQFYFRVKASNGEIVAQSEGYVSKEGCEDGIKSLITLFNPSDSDIIKIVDLTTPIND